jgi:DNA invertase Pin-like site-specific DNA recombinase
MSKPRAYSYIRMSTEIQLKGDSLRRQLEASQKYADEHGLELVEKDRLSDIGISAFKGANVTDGALGQFLTAVRDGKVEAGSFLLVESLDRLSRQQPLEALGIFTQIINAGIRIVTLIDQRVYSKATGFSDLIFSIATMSRAHEESETKSHRVSAAWANKRKNVGSRKLTAQCPAWLKLSDDKKSFQVIEKRAALIVSIFEDGAAGMGYYSITRRLNQSRIPTFGRSDGWQTSYVAKILANRAVLGEFQPHRAVSGKRVADGHPIKDYFPRIVDENLFYRAQSARVQRQNGGGRKGLNISNLFSGIAKCAYCKSRMRFENKGPRPKAGTYLVCDRARRGLDCEKTGWKYDDLEASFLTYVQEIDLASLVHTEADNAKRKGLAGGIAALSGQLTTITEQKERAYELYMKGGSKSDFVAQKLQELEQNTLQLADSIKEKEKELVGLTADLARFYESKDQIKALVEQIRTLDGQDAYKLRSLLASRLKSIVLSMSVASVGTTRLAREPDLTLNHEWEHRRYFMLEFKDGSARAVYPDPNDPMQFAEQITSVDFEMTIPTEGN